MFHGSKLLSSRTKNYITCFKQPKYAVMTIQKDFNSVLDAVLMSLRKFICCPDVNNDNDVIQTGHTFLANQNSGIRRQCLEYSESALLSPRPPYFEMLHETYRIQLKFLILNNSCV